MVENIKLIAQNAIRIEDQKGRIIYFDPFRINGKFSNDADFIFITHPHFDHFSVDDITMIKKENTSIIVPEELEDKVKDLGFDDSNIILVKPDNKYKISDIDFETVPAYNIGKDFHKKEYNWVGYVVKIDGKIIYIAGDTDANDEIESIKCDIACVPVGGTYTMDYKEAAKLIEKIKPEFAIPTHYQTIVGTREDAMKFKELLKGKVEVRIKMI